MALHQFSKQASLLLVQITLSLCILYTNGTTLLDAPASEYSACPKGWLKYEQFCVTKAQGTSDKAVALYCDGFGGIGIKGLCIIRAHTSDSSRDGTGVENSVSLDGESSYSTLPQESTGDSQGSSSAIFGELTPTHDGLCPDGWTHYRSLCVYKPWSVEERCQSMQAVHFSGLCIKHANTRSIGNENVENVYREDKRICCCASFKSPSNGYAC